MLLDKGLTLHYFSANHFQLERPSDIILPTLVAETTTGKSGETLATKTFRIFFTLI